MGTGAGGKRKIRKRKKKRKKGGGPEKKEKDLCARWKDLFRKNRPEESTPPKIINFIWLERYSFIDSYASFVFPN